MSGNILIFIAVFSMTVAIISIVRDVLLKDHRRISHRIEADFRALQREQVKQSPLFKESGKKSVLVTDLEDFSPWNNGLKS